jgi:glycosyltransferase involved in cell wall biosynthesis
MRAIFRDREEALLYPPEDAARLGDAIHSLLENADLAERVGRGGARLVEHRYGWDQHADELEGIFEETIGERRLRRSS